MVKVGGELFKGFQIWQEGS